MSLDQHPYSPDIHTSQYVYQYIETPIGQMVAIASDQALLLLEFSDCKKLAKQIDQVCTANKAGLSAQSNPVLVQLKKELAAYFNGELTAFQTPLETGYATDFQREVWQKLGTIGYGETWSYADLAAARGNPKAFRAVANANGANHMPIIIPCHRVINTGGKLGGYSGGLWRKEWLLAHEQKFKAVA